MSTNEKSIQDGRGSNRVEVSELIHVVNRRSGENIGQLVNISEQGLMILGDSALPDYSILQLQLILAADSEIEPINIGAESLWCNSSGDGGQHWIGFYIIDVSDKDLERIRYISNS